jgi:hypothetical protein
MTSDHAAYLLERRIQVGSWRFFLEQACGGGFTAAELMRITGAWLPRPFSEIQSHAEACQRAYGGCSTIRAQRDAWHAASGSDAWGDCGSYDLKEYGTATCGRVKAPRRDTLLASAEDKLPLRGSRFE